MTIVLCKDCGGQFRSPHPDGKIGELSEYAQTLGKTIKTVSCMDRCEKNKISLYKFSATTDYEKNINSMTLDEVFQYIKDH